MTLLPPRPTLFPYTTLFRSEVGKVVTWGFENAGVSQLAQEGYNRNTLKSGQEITAIVNPAANGAPTGIVVKVILADGSEIMSRDRKSTRLNSSHQIISYAVF